MAVDDRRPINRNGDQGATRRPQSDRSVQDPRRTQSDRTYQGDRTSQGQGSRYEGQGNRYEGQGTRYDDSRRSQGSRSVQDPRRTQNDRTYQGERTSQGQGSRYDNQGTRYDDSRRSQGSRSYDDPRRSQNQNRSGNSKSKQAKNKSNGKKKSGAGKIILLIVELLVLVGMGIFLYFVLIGTKAGKAKISLDDLVFNEGVTPLEMETTSSGGGGDDQNSENPTEAKSSSHMTGYRNIALFGVDSREKALTKNTRSDTIIIASIKEDTGEVKLCSVYRDTYLNLSNDQYNKCNAAYAKGGPIQAINMLNMNLDMNITDFVTIGFDGLIDVIDSLGGVEVNVLDSEIVHLNNYQISMVGKSTDGETFTADAGKDYTPVKSAGRQVLNGLQATAYCRIRYVGNDFQRAERQRSVIMAILDKAKANPSKLPSVAESLFDEVYTSLDLSEIISLLTDISKFTIVDQAGFPQTEKLAVGNIGSKGSCVVPLDLKDNVSWLHKFLFGVDNYEPSDAVKSYSEKVKEDTKSHI